MSFILKTKQNKKKKKKTQKNKGVNVKCKHADDQGFCFCYNLWLEQFPIFLKQKWLSVISILVPYWFLKCTPQFVLLLVEQCICLGLVHNTKNVTLKSISFKFFFFFFFF